MCSKLNYTLVTVNNYILSRYISGVCTWDTKGCPRFARNIILLLLSMMFLDDVTMWSLFICEEHDLVFYCIM